MQRKFAPMLPIVGLYAGLVLGQAAQAQAVDPKASSSAFTLDTPIYKIIADPAGKAVIDKDLPNLQKNPMFGSVQTNSLNQLARMSGGALTADMLAQVKSDLDLLKK